MKNKTGKYLAIILISFLVIWGLADLIIWRTGYQTMSQWVILVSEQKEVWALTWLGFCVLVIGIGIWLIFHWELPRILKKWIKKDLDEKPSSDGDSN